MKNSKVFIIVILSFLSGMLVHGKVHKFPEPVALIASEDLNKVMQQGTSLALNAQTVQAGKASWYSKRSPGIRYRTANNEVFDDQDMTCAMWGVPFNQRLKVTNRQNGKSVVVRVNDRGPHKRLVRKGRIVDLTRAAFQRIAHPQKGLIDVEIEFL